MQWTPLHLHSHFSLLDGLSQTDQIAEYCRELGYNACALTDHGNISGAVTFYKDISKVGMKPILGLEAYVVNDANEKERKSLHQVILARNLIGWNNLIQLVSISNDHFYYKPRLDFNLIKNYSQGLISYSGHPGSILYELVKNEKFKEAEDYCCQMREIFDEFFIEIQLIDTKNNPLLAYLCNAMRLMGNKLGIKCIATADSHYIRRSDSNLHHVLLCSNLKCTLRDVKSGKVTGLDGFFNNNNFHIPTITDLLEFGNTEEEIDNTNYVSSLCENYDIRGQTKLPQYTWTDGKSELDYLRYLCQEGWNRKLSKIQNKDIYKERLQHEFKVINEANLAGYFLIVQDYVNYAKSQNWLVGPGRGSGAGCLISYLLNITSTDPIKYNLLFERFYNAGRNTPGNISYPDIDVDFPITKRDKVIDYIRNKYGHDKVAQICTFGRLQGRGALKEVLRVYGACSFNQMNEMTKGIPNESEISDELEEQQETSIIKWTLNNRPKVLSDWCQVNDKDELTGDYSQYFKEAIALEGTYKTQGKHAAGIVIAPEPIHTLCPMIKDKSGDDKMIGFDMRDIGELGLLKMDILGVAILDKLMGVNELLSTGKISNA